MIYGREYLKGRYIRFYKISSIKLIKDMLHETINQNKYLIINPIVINNYLLMEIIGKKMDVINCDVSSIIGSF